MLTLQKNGRGWKLVGAVAALPSLADGRRFASDPRFMAAAGCAGCKASDHVRCPGCGHEVCLGMLSDLQASRVRTRVAQWHGCAQAPVENAHDALSDVRTTIGLMRRFREFFVVGRAA